MRNHDTRHHRRPRSLGGGNEKTNISFVSQNKHRAWHTLFSNYSPYRIADIINDDWLDSDYMFIVVKRH